MPVFRAADPHKPPRDATPPTGENGWPSPPPRTPEAAFPEGPTERLGTGPAAAPKPKARPKVRGRAGAGAALVLSAVALLAAGLSVVLGWQAFVTARHVAARYAGAVQPAPSTPAATTAPPRPVTPLDYPVTYAKEPLRVQVGCAAVLFLDLDEPRTDAGERASDLRYDSRCGREAPKLTPGPGAAGVSQMPDADVDAAGCQRAVRTGPLGPGASVPVERGAVLCVLTAATPAKLVLVEITDAGQTGTASIRATSWTVTG